MHGLVGTMEKSRAYAWGQQADPAGPDLVLEQMTQSLQQH